VTIIQVQQPLLNLSHGYYTPPVKNISHEGKELKGYLPAPKLIRQTFELLGNSGARRMPHSILRNTLKASCHVFLVLKVSV
jgi:hypothetical protein